MGRSGQMKTLGFTNCLLPVQLFSFGEQELSTGEKEIKIKYMLPWIDVQELDGLKRDADMSRMVKTTLKFIRKILAKKSSNKIISQKRCEVRMLERRYPIWNRKNEDRLIDICLSLIEQGDEIIMYSDDTGVIIKCNIEEITYRDFYGMLRSLNSNFRY
ncbi:hypothetical protein JTE90_018688 [Oedothorax gibbosus]|uniref:PIN domain-containing protein n=1 Tax=Oedothorax gibbosus TaxID=931172 RepID=A0AAV6V066_9ARAC|nr:hypothetical protein JTE90_018688 [Oedothorax gibbosus]